MDPNSSTEIYFCLNMQYTDTHFQHSAIYIHTNHMNGSAETQKNFHVVDNGSLISPTVPVQRIIITNHQEQNRKHHIIRVFISLPQVNVKPKPIYIYTPKGPIAVHTNTLLNRVAFPLVNITSHVDWGELSWTLASTCNWHWSLPYYRIRHNPQQLHQVNTTNLLSDLYMTVVIYIWIRVIYSRIQKSFIVNFWIIYIPYIQGWQNMPIDVYDDLQYRNLSVVNVPAQRIMD